MVPPTTRSDGTLKGFEIAYQTFFDTLPGAWSGLGVQVNYTKTKQEDINNSNLAVQAGYLPGSTTAFGGGNNTSTGGNGNAGNPLSFTSNVIDSHRLAGISDDSFNVVGLYEYGKVGARLAYSWRSEFLTANLDCCIGFPCGRSRPDISMRRRATRSMTMSSCRWTFPTSSTPRR